MRSPADMQIIQVEVTNACPLKCGNCTHLSPHVSKDTKLEISLPTFEKSLDSLQGFGGLVGLIGGEPTIHPQFEQLCDAFRAGWGSKEPLRVGRKPIADFAAYVNERLFDKSSGRGLWTSLGPAFYRHMETIADTFSYLCVNDHRGQGLHQAALIDRNSYLMQNRISEDEWLKNRDNCWVQNTWSASITQNGAYFCEVAGAIDQMFYGGKHAWPIEKGWWRRQPKDFGEQLNLCNHCALAQPGPSMVANEDRDILSINNAYALEQAGSPCAKKGRYVLYDAPQMPEKRVITTLDSYMPAPEQRVSPDNDSIRPQNVVCVLVCVGYGDKLATTLPRNAAHFGETIVVTHPEDHDTIAVCEREVEKGRARLVLSQSCYEGRDAFNKGRMLNEALKSLRGADWILFTDADILLPKDLGAFLKTNSLNPGCLYYTQRVDVQTYQQAFNATVGPVPASGVNAEPNGYFQLWNRRARAIRDRWPHVLSTAFCSAGGVDSWFMQQWPADKRIMLPGLPVAHLEHGAFGANWNGPQPAGLTGRWLQYGMITTHGFVLTSPDGWLSGRQRFRLTDTLRGEQAEVEIEVGGQAFPMDVIRLSDHRLIFKGRDIGHHHIHVAYRDGVGDDADANTEATPQDRAADCPQERGGLSVVR